jgi:glutathione peroxidase
MKTLLLMFAFLFGPKSTATSIYEFKVDGLTGGTIDFAAFKGKKILIVNTASKCGYTPQYKELQQLHEKFKDKLIIVGFPANNFMWQEPGNNTEIAEFCQKNYGVTFLMAAKVSVKGSDMHPLFRWLIEQPNPDFTGSIKWNFEKFLIDENGKLIHRFRSGVNPMSDDIIQYLK